MNQMNNDNKNPEEMSNDELLHTLWTKAVGTDGYIKAQWHELAERLCRLTEYEKKKKSKTHY